MSTFREILSKLFTRNVVVKRLPGGRLKAYDVNKSQMTGNEGSAYNSPVRWRSGRGMVSSGYGNGFTNEEIEAQRRQLYIDYELMDTNDIISSVLDIFSEESTTLSIDGELLVIKTDNEEIKKILHNLFYDVLNIEFNMWGWIRTMCKYGDAFLYMQLHEKFGVVNVTPIHPSLIVREEGTAENPDQIRFRYDGVYGYGTSTNSYFEAYEIAHFRLISDPLFLPYGKSIVYSSIKTFKALCLDENTRIWTPRGYKFIKNIHIGDEIYSYNANFNQYEITKVKNVICTDTRNVVRVRTSHRSIVTTPEHIFLTNSGYKAVSELTVNDRLVIAKTRPTILNDGKYPSLDCKIDTFSNFDGDYYKSTVSNVKGVCIVCGEKFKSVPWMHYKHKHGLTVEEYGALKGGQKNYERLISLNKKIDTESALRMCELYNLDPTKLITYIRFGKTPIVNIDKIYTNYPQFIRFFGFMIGDGWIDGVSVCFSLGIRLDKSMKYVELMTELGLNPKIANEGTSRASCSVQSMHFVKIFELLDFRTGTRKKIIPNWVFELPEYDRREFLYGFADADGCDLPNGSFTIGGVNKILIYDMQCLAQQSGLTSTNIRHVISPSNFNPNNNCETYTFNFSDNKDRYTDELNTQKITSIVECENTIVYDIETESDNHNFIADGIVVHNCMIEDAMLLHRIMRSPERRLFKIDVGNLPPEAIDAHIEQIVADTKKIPVIDPVTGDFNLKFAMMSQLDDVYLPVRGGDSGTTIETLAGLENAGQIEDVEYFKNKLLAGLKVPKEYLGYSEGGESRSNLAQTDVRFARSIERIQKIFVSELYKIAVIHLHTQGFETEQLIDFELFLTNPSLVFERQKTDTLVAKVDLVASMRENNLFSDKYIYENIFGLTEDVWKGERDRIIEDKKHAFRLKQIEEEGNDPKETGKSFGTRHDIASMQVASKFRATDGEDLKKLYTPDGREDNARPDQHTSSFETVRDQDFGRDPVGRRENEKMNMPKAESVKRILKLFKKKPQTPNILNEEQLFDDEA